MKTRTIKELLQLMLDNKRHLNSGLCKLNNDLYLKGYTTYFENEILRKYMQENKPKTFHNVVIADGYWWFPYRVFPRIKWIKKHIKLNS